VVGSGEGREVVVRAARTSLRWGWETACWRLETCRRMLNFAVSFWTRGLRSMLERREVGEVVVERRDWIEARLGLSGVMVGDVNSMAD